MPVFTRFRSDAARRRQRAVRRWLRPRSAGVRVARRTLRLIDRGDAARDRGAWTDAAAAYRAALEREPALAHIWVQLGHALRETGDGAAATQAYGEAVRCAPRDRETRFALADLARVAGDRDALVEHLLAAVRLDPADRRARAILLRALSASHPGHAPLIAEVLGATPRDARGPATAPASPRLWVDIGDLVDHLVRTRLPSGLQRLEIEAGRAMLAMVADGVALCCHAPAEAAWKAVSGNDFLALVDAAAAIETVDEAGWYDRLMAMLATLAYAPAIAFEADVTLFNFGFAWGDRGYHPAVAALKASSGIRFAALACDVIPLVRPDEMPGDIVAACGAWLDDLAAVADRVVVVSAATRDELVATSAARGRPVAAEIVAVARHDGGFTPPGRPLPVAKLDRWRIAAGRFVLYPSTIEPRKNHLGALAAWGRLIADLGDAAVPDLVFVGRMGWMGAAVGRWLDGHPAVARRVHMLAGISDAELDLLYRTCAFMLYPSLHEGWGMPITEALTYGKVPAIGRNSSLPEAGGRFAVYYDADDPRSIAEAVAALIADPAALAARETLIRTAFHPRSWQAIAEDFVAAALG